ncbi:hypothetical protein T11_15773 [Trichinella zimbabwensis]|uniref:Integrase catalytic domain-containing protein n=1 Tax=Trichinella zimbabwensis TaxID=268475 RepID=A0A0V1I1N4_9BILA|nr:hypothetical protein T11_15773 [Trichinella zimbabwensis]
MTASFGRYPYLVMSSTVEIWLLLEANKVTYPMTKRAALLSYCGGPVFKLIRALVLPANPSDKSFEKILFVLGEHFSPQPSEIMKCNAFHKRNQKVGESISDFIADLRQLAQGCSFSELEIMLRDRVVIDLQEQQSKLRYARAVEAHTFDFSVVSETLAAEAQPLGDHRPVPTWNDGTPHPDHGILLRTHAGERKIRARLSLLELQGAEKRWVRAVQAEAFPVPKTSSEPISVRAVDPLAALSPFMDTEELHAGLNQTLAALRRRFWVVRGRQAVKRCIRACIICRKHDARPFCPLISDLPPERVTPSFPFNRVGLDFAGPLHVKDEQRPLQKVYICLFTCMVMRAVHLELVLDMTTISFLAALRRFIARRGRPSVIHSDNFRTFKQADLFLRDLLHGKSAEKIQEELAMRQIEWRYSTDRAPWCGGYWERLVRSMKSALRKVLGKELLRSWELHTVLCELEAQINDRPLTLLSDDPHDCAPLTPAHFLNGQELASLPIPAASASAPTNASGLCKRWRYLELLMNHLRRSVPGGRRRSAEPLETRCDHRAVDGKRRGHKVSEGTDRPGLLTRPSRSLILLEPASVRGGDVMGTCEGERVNASANVVLCVLRWRLTFLSLRRASDSVSETQLPRVHYVLQPIFSADCGVQATSNSLYKHLVVILPERHPDEKQCLGTILHLQHNDTYSDTILTSKSCLKSKELKSTVVVSLFDFSKTDTLKGIHIVRSIFPKTLGHLASKAQSTINSPVNMNRNYALLKLKNPIMYDREKHSVCLPQESEVNFPISRHCYLPTVYKNGRIGSPMKVAVHSKEIDANYSSENYQQMDLIVEAKSIFNNRKRIHQGEFIMIGMPMLCIDAEKYFDVDKYFQYGIFDQQKTILKRDLSKLIYLFTSLFNVLNHIMFVVSTKEFHHGYPGVDTEAS